MGNNVFHRKMRTWLKENRWKKQLVRLGTALSALMVFLVAGSLMQPANTMTTVCGYEEHRHDEACYKLRQICEQEENEEHVHGDDCYERVLNCAILEHIHTDACYPAATEAPVTEEPYVIEPTVAPEEPEETPVPKTTDEPTVTGAPVKPELPSDVHVQVDETLSASETPAPEPANDDVSGRVSITLSPSTDVELMGISLTMPAFGSLRSQHDAIMKKAFYKMSSPSR